jgi:hypothetical protein
MARIPKCERLANRNRRMIDVLMIILIIVLLINFAQWFNILPSDVQQALTPITFMGTASISIPSDILFILDSRYESDVKEFVYCLYGTKQGGDNLIVNSMRETTIKYATSELAYYESCSKTSDFLGIIHSHPQTSQLFVANCDLSETDKKLLTDSDLTIVGVICGEEKMAFYTKNDFEKSMRIREI